MILTLKASESMEEKSLRETVEGCGKQVLGRLARRISHAMISMREQPGAAGQTVHACTLRLSMPGAADTLVESQRPDRDAAVANAFKRARYELVRRGRRFV